MEGIKSHMTGAVELINKLRANQEQEPEEPVKLRAEDQMLNPPLEFVGTQAEIDYMAQFKEPSIDPIEEPKYKVETLPDNESHNMYSMRRIIDKERKYIRKAHNASMDYANNYKFPNYKMQEN